MSQTAATAARNRWLTHAMIVATDIRWNPMCIGPIAACLTDLGVTLAGQPAKYWSGDYALVLEGNPIPRWLLQQHPLVLVAVIVAWIFLFVATIARLSKAPAQIVAFAILMGHTFSASTWFLARPYGVLQCAPLFFIAWYCDRFIWEKTPDAVGQQPLSR